MEKQFKIPRVVIDGAKWARGVYTCPFCEKTLEEPHLLYYYVVGIADTQWGQFKIVECPFCFERYYSHVCCSDLFHIQGFADRNEHLKHLV